MFLELRQKGNSASKGNKVVVSSQTKNWQREPRALICPCGRGQRFPKEAQ